MGRLVRPRELVLTMKDAKPPISESAFQDRLIAEARLRGWLVAHFRPGRTATGWRTPVQGDAGFPDLVLVRGGRLIWAELKSEKGKLSEKQEKWIRALRECGCEVHIWRPSSISDVEAALR